MHHCFFEIKMTQTMSMSIEAQKALVEKYNLDAEGLSIVYDYLKNHNGKIKLIDGQLYYLQNIYPFINNIDHHDEFKNLLSRLNENQLGDSKNATFGIFSIEQKHIEHKISALEKRIVDLEENIFNTVPKYYNVPVKVAQKIENEVSVMDNLYTIKLIDKSYCLNDKALSYLRNVKKMFDKKKTNLIFLTEISSVEMDIIIDHLSCICRYGHISDLAAKFNRKAGIQRVYDSAVFLGFNELADWYVEKNRVYINTSYKPM
ncbi:putative orfan [Tupanvirus soda lake]|uniref:Orfan n=2 Tax=Tupanvirus TaxID=2094720 RepID=A0AC62AAL7_9VIRU|nr:putative orfan [Tupanvirus soda lake]QKU34784.1 putative orfan [Tupanvirus soda lake]